MYFWTILGKALTTFGSARGYIAGVAELEIRASTALISSNVYF